MKIFFFIMVTVYVTASATISEEVELENHDEESSTELLPKNGVYADDCLKEVQVPEEDIKKLKNKDISNASNKLQCYLNCVMEKDEIIFDGILNGDVIYERLQNITMLNEENATKISNICKSIEGDDKCDISYKLSKCFIEHKANFILWRVATIVQN